MCVCLYPDNQVQIRYTRLNGMQCVRVISRGQPITQDRFAAEAAMQVCCCVSECVFVRMFVHLVSSLLVSRRSGPLRSLVSSFTSFLLVCLCLCVLQSRVVASHAAQQSAETAMKGGYLASRVTGHAFGALLARNVRDEDSSDVFRTWAGAQQQVCACVWHCVCVCVCVCTLTQFCTHTLAPSHTHCSVSQLHTHSLRVCAPVIPTPQVDSALALEEAEEAVELGAAASRDLEGTEAMSAMRKQKRGGKDKLATKLRSAAKSSPFSSRS